MSVRVASMAILALSVCMWLGCGEKDPYGRQAVSGKVTLDGQAVGAGSIDFVPTGSSPVRSGTVVVQGEYSIPQDKGLPPGEYIVQISVPDPEGKKASNEPGPGPVVNLAPPDWSADSQHKITVTDGGSNEFNFDMTSAK
jgi:hypothetical protein